MRIAAPAYIVPFMFVYEPSLLMIGDWTTIVTSTIIGVIGVMCLAAGLMGYLCAAARGGSARCWSSRPLLLIKPGYVSDAIGLAVLGGLFLMNTGRARVGIKAGE